MTDPLPEGSLLLHIGPQKTGSTAIQQALHAARDRLAAEGVLYPGPFYRLAAEASQAVLGIRPAVGRPEPRIEAWHDVVGQIAESTLPRAVLSSEGLGLATAGAVPRVVEDLGGDRVHLVYVARRVDRLLSSTWQERVKASLTTPYHRYLTQMLGDRDPAADHAWEWRMMWDAQDVGGVIERWATRIDRDRITVIVADEDDRGSLPRAFEQLLALPTGVLAAPDTGLNRSLTMVEVEVVRRINEVFVEQEWSKYQYWRIVQAGVVERLKNSPRVEDSRIPAPPTAALDRIADRADAQADAIASSGVRVIGDVDRLRTRGRLQADDEPPVVDEVPTELLGRVFAGTKEGTRMMQVRAMREQRNSFGQEPAGEPASPRGGLFRGWRRS